MPTPTPTPDPFLYLGENDEPGLSYTAADLPEIFLNAVSWQGVYDDFPQLARELSLPAAPTFTDILDRREELAAFSEELERRLLSVIDRAIEQTATVFEDLPFTCTIDAEIPGWRYLGAYLWSDRSAFSPEEILELGSSVREDENGNIVLEVFVTPRAFAYAALDRAGDSAWVYMTSRYIMDYLTTVYDDQGKQVRYQLPDLPKGFGSDWVRPTETAVFRDTWFAGRSKGTRKHTGLDLKAPAETPICSCTDGRVLYTGYGAIEGFYVVILDDLGYEYQYFHMIRESSFLKWGQYVSAGDLIGYVGNSGNSDTNHLHLSVVSPDNVYIKTYSIMSKVYARRNSR